MGLSVAARCGFRCFGGGFLEAACSGPCFLVSEPCLRDGRAVGAVVHSGCSEAAKISAIPLAFPEQPYEEPTPLSGACMAIRSARPSRPGSLILPRYGAM